MPTPKHVLTLTLVLGLCLDITALSQEAPPFPDVNPNGFIDSSDLFALASGWGSETGLSGGDVDGSGSVGPEDLLVLLQQWRTSDLRLIWAKWAAGVDVSGLGIASSGDGGVLVTGEFSGSATFGEGNHQLTLESAGGGDIFIAKYDSEGDLVWVQRAGSPLNDQGTAVDIFPDGSFVVAGFIGDSAAFGSGDREVVLTSGLHRSMFVAKYDSNGNLAWARTASGREPSLTVGEAVGITGTGEGGAYVTGRLIGTLTFGEVGPRGESRPVILNAGFRNDAFVGKYNADGSLTWIHAISSFGVPGFRNITGGMGITSLPDGSAVMTGHKNGISPSPGDFIPGNLLVSKYNSNGTIAWETRSTNLTPASGRTIAPLPDGSVAVAGYFVFSATLGEEGNQIPLTSAGFSDVFVAKYEPNGRLAWARSVGGPETDIAYDIATSLDGSIFVTGFFREIGLPDTSSFAEGDRQVTLTSRGEHDIFVVKYNPDGNLAAATTAGGPGFDGGAAIAALLDGSVVVAGAFGESAIFGEGRDQILLNPEGGSNVFIARYASTVSW